MPRPRTSALLLRAVTAGVLVLVAGCSGSSSPDDVDWSPLPRVERDVPAPVADRDLAAVQRSLATVDACALLDREALAEVGVPGARRDELDPVSPSECYVGYDTLYVRLYEALPTSTRYSWARTQVGDHLAYTQAREKRGGCRVGLPVDFDHVVMVASLSLRCPVVLAAAGVVADRLTAADGVLRPPGLQRVSACGLAAVALGVGLDSPRLVAGPDGPDGADLDDCQVLGPDDAPVGPSVDVALELGPPVASLLENSGYRRASVGGQDVAQTGRRPCYLHADLPADRPGGASGDSSTGSGRSVLGLQVNAGTCRQGRAVVGKLLRAAVDPAVTAGPLLALSDLLLTVDDVTGPLRGACADVMPTNDGCVPLDDLADAEVPSDPVQLLREGQADPAVTCAAAATTVREVYGTTMAPTVSVNPASGDQTCTFAGPDHVAQVAVEAVLEDDNRQLATTVGGHPADRLESDSPQYAVNTWTIAHTDEDHPGRLVVSVTCVPEPGDIFGAPYDPACVDRAEDLVDGLATALLA